MCSVEGVYPRLFLSLFRCFFQEDEGGVYFECFVVCTDGCMAFEEDLFVGGLCGEWVGNGGGK